MEARLVGYFCRAGLGIDLGGIIISSLGVALGVALGVTLGLKSGMAACVALGIVYGVALGVASGLALGVTSGVALGIVYGAVSLVAAGVAAGIVFHVAFLVALSVAFGVAILRPESWLFGLGILLKSRNRNWWFPRVTPLPIPSLAGQLTNWLRQDWETGLHNANELLGANIAKLTPAAK